MIKSLQPLKNYKYAVIATDVVIFTIKDDKLQVILIKMKREPFIGHWALPGGLVKIDESVDASAQRHLLTKTGVKDIYLEQLFTFGEVKRDPHGRVVSVAYFALIPNAGLNIKTSEEYLGIDWYPVEQLPKMAYDHKQILKIAVDRLQAKVEYTNIVYSLMSKEFSLSELQETYEIILKRKLDKRNFRKKILSLKLLVKSGKTKTGEAYRPAELYSFAKRVPQIMEVI